MDNNITLPPAICDTATVVGVNNLKCVGEQPAMLSNLAYSNVAQTTNLSHQNAVANQQALNELGIAIVGKTVNKVSNVGPLEARSVIDLLTNNELAQAIADLKSTIYAFLPKANAT